jgi:hypothetical protein
VPRKRSAAALRQYGEAIVEPRGEGLDAKDIDLGRRQFERQRHAVKPAANLYYRLEIGSAERDAFHGRRCALVKELDGRIMQRIAGREIGRFRRKFQRSQPVYPFAFGPQRFAAGGQNMRCAALLLGSLLQASPLR